MRENLKKFDKQKIIITDKFVRYGNSYSKIKSNHRLDNKSYKLLFRDVVIKSDTDIFVGHMWFGHSKLFRSLGLMERDDKVSMAGIVKKYTKKGQNKEILTDYEIVPTSVRRI